MTKQCRSCKREIAKGQSVCYICGSKQSFISHHILSILFTFGLIGTVSATSYWYVEQSAQQAITEQAKIVEAIKSESNKELQSLQQELDQANHALKLAKTNADQVNNAATDTNLKTQKIEERAKKAEARAAWLSKENRRFKKKVKELNQKISDMQKPKPAISSNQLPNLSPDTKTSQSPAIEQSSDDNIASSAPQTNAVTDKKQSDDSAKQASSEEPTPPSGE